MLGERRQACHELLERLERLCVLREADIQLAKPHKVRRERGVVEGIVPTGMAGLVSSLVSLDHLPLVEECGQAFLIEGVLR